MFYEDMTISLMFIAYSNIHKWSLFEVPWQIFLKLLQPVVEPRTLPREGSNKYAWIRSVYNFVFWMSRLFDNEIDVQHWWFCAVATSGSDVRRYVACTLV
jgi:hypothetical protein